MINNLTKENVLDHYDSMREQCVADNYFLIKGILLFFYLNIFFCADNVVFLFDGNVLSPPLEAFLKKLKLKYVKLSKRKKRKGNLMSNHSPQLVVLHSCSL